MEKLEFRFADEADVGLILKFIKELAEYEKMLDEVVVVRLLRYRASFHILSINSQNALSDE